jgi:hypothetical protein
LGGSLFSSTPDDSNHTIEINIFFLEIFYFTGCTGTGQPAGPKASVMTRRIRTVKHVEDLLIDDDVEKMIVMLAAKEPEVQLHRQWALPTQWEAILPTTSILRGQHF